VDHWFCKYCGIAVYHNDAAATRFRINLGCVDEIAVDALPLRMFDGRDSWEYLN